MSARGLDKSDGWMVLLKYVQKKSGSLKFSDGIRKSMSQKWSRLVSVEV